MSEGTLRLAVAQAPASLVGWQARLNWLQDALPNMKQEGVDLVLLPELFASGYHIGGKLADNAEPADGPMAAEISNLAKSYELAIHYGYPERDGEVLYNAAQCFGPDGHVLTQYRKRAIPPGFERDYFSQGRKTALFTYRGFRIATLICYDAEFPEAAREVAKEGAELILVPTALGADWGWVAEQMIPTRAYENGVFLAYANSAGVENGMSFLGGSFIAAPNGREVAKAGNGEEVIFAQLDRTLVGKAQDRLPYLVDNAVF